MTTHHRIITTAAVALALGAGATPASALINRPGSVAPGQPSPVPPTIVHPNPDQQAPAAGSPTIVRPYPKDQVPAAASPAIVHVSAPSNGFDWGDAGVGAAGGFALSMLGLGGALVVSQRRTRPRHSATA